MNGALYTQHRKTPKNPESLTSRVERLLSEQGPSTSSAMAELLGTSKSHVTNALATLQKSRRAHTAGTNGRNQAIYAFGPPPAGHKPKAAELETSIATPRRIIGIGPYTPTPWTPPRPGSTQQELGIPSRGPAGRRPWAEPMHGCVGMLKETANQGRD